MDIFYSHWLTRTIVNLLIFHPLRNSTLSRFELLPGSRAHRSTGLLSLGYFSSWKWSGWVGFGQLGDGYFIYVVPCGYFRLEIKQHYLATHHYDFVELKATLLVRNHFVAGRFGKILYIWKKGMARQIDFQLQFSLPGDLVFFHNFVWKLPHTLGFLPPSQ